MESDRCRPAPEPTEVIDSRERQAAQLRESISPLFMYASMIRAFKGFDAGAYKIFRDRLIADCGNPKDPIEVMIVEQLALAHLNTGLLQCRAANDGAIEATAVYASAAARLMAEFRRSALALQGYRAAARHLANDPSKDRVIASDATETPDESPWKKSLDDELVPRTEAPDVDPFIIRYPEPAASRDQSSHAPGVAPNLARRASKTSRCGDGDPAVGAGDRAANS